MLDDRRSHVLQALVEEYIRTGQPVSSQGVLEHAGLGVSSATIRNDLAKLESYGFVTQPHTSAGRIPTPQGYRYYVDHCSPARLRAVTRSRIEGFFGDVHRGLSKLLKDTSGLLSEVSHYPSVVLGPGFAGEVVRGIHLVHLGQSTVLAVVVGERGQVSQELVRLAFDPTGAELDEAEATLVQAYGGESLGHGEVAVAGLHADLLGERVRAIVKAVAAAVQRADKVTSDVYVGGHSQLAALWHDLATVSAVLSILDEDSTLRTLMHDAGEGTAVRIGSELNLDEVDLAVVSTTYEAGDQGIGRVGVFGPMRMDYRRTIRIVEEVGDGLADSLGS
ncbi:MAG TPA: heat-inducible transcriptional repressor HrcA [Acidimicrobiia bacterium]|jgi:heat-inducible transcriptional repressor